MIGAIIGDIVGSRFEWNNHRSKDFDLLPHSCFFTDDSVMSLAICDAFLRINNDYSNLSEQVVKSMQSIGRHYSDSGYGGAFYKWVFSDNPQPYNSYGNGAAMRVSSCAYVANSLEEVKELSNAVTKVSHNHPEGLKGAEAVAVAVFLARTGHSLIEIQDFIRKNYYQNGFTIDSIRETYTFNETCQDTVDKGNMFTYSSSVSLTEFANRISVEYCDVSLSNDTVEAVSVELNIEPNASLELTLDYVHTIEIIYNFVKAIDLPNFDAFLREEN